MKFILFIKLLISFNLNIINNYLEKLPIYEYKEMKEIRYIFFYNLENFNINNIEIYAGEEKIQFNYEINNYYTVDLNNYYPLTSITIKNNNKDSKFSLKINNKKQYNEKGFAYIDIIDNKTIININNLIIDNPKWSNIIYSHKKIKETKTFILIK